MTPAIERELQDGARVRLEALRRDIVRIRVSDGAAFTDTGLNRYGFITAPDPGALAAHAAPDAAGQLTLSTGTLRLTCAPRGAQIQVSAADGRQLLQQTSAAFSGRGSVARFAAAEGEDWMGFGDQCRDRLFHRGHVADCHVRNVQSYVPVPFFMSNRGVAVLVNTTYRIVFDMCKSDPDSFGWRDGRSEVDYYVMVGTSYRELLDVYTDLTGKPKLPPEWAFGLWYICRTQADDGEVVNDALNFRREQIPCDVIGLEPGWMDKDYDESVDKDWSRQRFPIPSYCRNGPHNFFNALYRMGFRLELWLCCDYDLSYAAEQRLHRDAAPAAAGPEAAGFFHPDSEQDEHFSAPRYLDRITRRDQPWFEHLRQFVDQGVSFFKQDGAWQVLDHPDRAWGNGMLDAEMHNLYPLLYARQMYEGFAAHVGRRPVTFTVAGWTGFQAWTGTWTGDTGGRLETLGAMLNTAAVGHSWATNDMEVMQKEGIHFGYLLPWSQINSWNYFRMPWLQGPELAAMHRDYAQLRARLIPYIYTWAYEATRTGFPLMAPLPLEFSEDEACRPVLHEFLLGRDLLVTIYKPEVYFPRGRWKDYWTGTVFGGKRRENVTWPENRGGGLFVREGAIIPFGPVMQFRGERAVDEIELYVFPAAAASSFTLYEDDGVSLAHRHGEFAETRIEAQRDGQTTRVCIQATQGRYDGLPADRSWGFRIALAGAPSRVRRDGAALPPDQWHYDSDRAEVVIAPGPGPTCIEISAPV